MSHDSQKQALLSAVSCIRSAQALLMQANRDTADPANLAKINEDYAQLDSFLSQMLHCIAITDDKDFTDKTAVLKKQAGTLQVQEEHFKSIGAGVNTAAQIVGCIAQALAFIAKV